MRIHRLAAVLTLTVLAAPLGAAAQDGRLKVRVSPREAFVFVDDKAIGEGSRTLRLAPGSYKVGVYNYGYKPFAASVSIAAGQTQTITADLEPLGASASGPWGRIQIENSPRGAVLLNGKSPEFLVGHNDEFNHDWIWKQELLVPPGTHLLTIVRDGSEVWSGQVTVAANQRVILDVGRNSQRTTDWPRGQRLGSLPRFRTGLASATVAVSPTSISSFTATPERLQCGDSSKLAWQTVGASEITLDGAKVSAGGEQLVAPRATTNYSLTAAGVGGRETRTASVNVNTAPTATFSASPTEVRYHKIGDRVVESGTTTLSWTTANADAVSIAPAPGSVPASGSRGVQPAPRATAVGPLNETVAYTLTAANVCGGRETRTASVRLTGAIEAMPEVVLASVFFPTDYPDERNPGLGLLRSQQRNLSLLAAGFKKYLEYDRAAKLVLEAHADERRSAAYNRALSQRRAARVKQFLVDQGVPAAAIDATAFGEDRNLDRKAVKDLEAQNPAKAPRARLGNVRGDWLAHNRRVDLVLRPSGMQSARFYPHAADDAAIIWQVPKPAKRVVEKNQ
jgi:peptidoglycan-associated lipoprotein